MTSSQTAAVWLRRLQAGSVTLDHVCLSTGTPLACGRQQTPYTNVTGPLFLQNTAAFLLISFRGLLRPSKAPTISYQGRGTGLPIPHRRDGGSADMTALGSAKPVNYQLCTQAELDFPEARGVTRAKFGRMGKSSKVRQQFSNLSAQNQWENLLCLEVTSMV